jgi:hypothetical protein
VNRRCVVRESVPACDDGIRIRVEVTVGPHPMVELTAARTMLVLLEELRVDRVPVRLVQVAVCGQLWGEGTAQ